VLLGTNTEVHSVVGLAADSAYFYVAGQGRNSQGLFRIARGAISGPAVQIGIFPTSSIHTSVVADSGASAANLYVRPLTGNIEAFVDPGGAAARVGVLSTLGSGSDYGMAYDPWTEVLYFFETETSAAGRVVMLQ